MFNKKYVIMLFSLVSVSFSAFAGSVLLSQSYKTNYNNNQNIATSNQLYSVVVIPKDIVDRQDGYMGANRSHVIRLNKSNDIYKTLGLEKKNVNSINLGWDKNHRPSSAYKIIDYYLSEEIKGNWKVYNTGVYKAGSYKSLDPLKANRVNAVLKQSDKQGKYDVYLYGMYGSLSLDGWKYGIYWDINNINLQNGTETKEEQEIIDTMPIEEETMEPITEQYIEYTKDNPVTENHYVEDTYSYRYGAEEIIEDDAELAEGDILK